MSILEILEAHRPTAEHYCGACPQWTPPDEDLDAVHSMNDVDWFMRAHVAQVLEEHMQEREVVAWDKCARSIVYEDGTPVEIKSITNPYRGAS